MMGKRTPKGTKPVVFAGFDWSCTIEEPKTICKHGVYSCDICGTSDRRDTLHTTKGGSGVVGKLTKKRGLK
jgi:hypothetical protein